VSFPSIVVRRRSPGSYSSQRVDGFDPIDEKFDITCRCERYRLLGTGKVGFSIRPRRDGQKHLDDADCICLGCSNIDTAVIALLSPHRPSKIVCIILVVGPGALASRFLLATSKLRIQRTAMPEFIIGRDGNSFAKTGA